MPVKFSEIATAISRLTFNLEAEIQKLRDTHPKDLNSAADKRARREFLAQSHPNAAEAADFFERVLEGNELQPASYLVRGAIAAQAVCRVEVRNTGNSRIAWGTGFLIAPNVLITNNHVLPSRDLTTNSRAHFRYELDLNDRPQPPVEFQLDPQQLFFTDKPLDFTVVAVRPTSLSANTPLRPFGYLPLLDVPGKALEGEWLTIVQHPAGEPKQLCVRENRLIKRTDDVLWYSTDTLGGSSGSPVFNNDWYVVALHHSGVPDRVGDQIRGVDGQLHNANTIREDQVKWIANEGIRASRIAATLQEQLPNHPLLAPLYRATPESARISLQSLVLTNNPLQTQLPTSSGNITMNAGNYTSPVTLRIASDRHGNLQINCDGKLASGAQESVATYERSTRAAPAAPDFVFDANYSATGKRKGYAPGFLGKDGAGKTINVLLPTLSTALRAKATKLLAAFGGGIELKYFNYTVVMHKARGFGIYSAANVSAGNRFHMSRPPDVWRVDPRIPTNDQVTNSYYVSNEFDRGHLTRREDLEFGSSPKNALQSAADTCHWTNCTPQHAEFNQNTEIWQGIERHILEDAIKSDRFSAQVLTGPIFTADDPEYRDLQYPVSYWKVVAAINADDKLVATAYIASQAEVIDQFGIEAAPADPFGPFKNFQVRISEIERLTDLTFNFTSGGAAKSLTSVDPLPTAARRRRNRSSANEARQVSPGGYLEIRSPDDIITGQRGR